MRLFSISLIHFRWEPFSWKVRGNFFPFSDENLFLSCFLSYWWDGANFFICYRSRTASSLIIKGENFYFFFACFFFVCSFWVGTFSIFSLWIYFFFSFFKTKHFYLFIYLFILSVDLSYLLSYLFIIYFREGTVSYIFLRIRTHLFSLLLFYFE